MPARSFAKVSNENAMGLCRAEERRARQQAKAGVPRQERHTYFCRLAICFTASTAPGRGSSSKKKSFDSQMLTAFS